MLLFIICYVILIIIGFYMGYKYAEAIDELLNR